MAYTKINWQNGVTPLNATNLNKMDQGIYDAHQLINLVYPVGCYFETTDENFDPQTAFGGTWVLETPGQVHVSAGTGYAVAGALTNTSDGGSKDAIAVSHSHTASATADGYHAHGFDYYAQSTNYAGETETGGTLSGSGSKYRFVNSAYSWFNLAGTQAGGSHSHSITVNSAGSDGTGKNMQPYINVYRWHRTA